MKVLQINSVCGQGSTGRIATDLANVLNSHGHSCLIAYGRYEAPATVNAVKLASNASVTAHGIRARLTDKHGLYSKGATKKLIKTIQNYDPDIILLHNIHGYYLNYELLFKYLAKINKPVLWTLHDCWAFTGHCAYFDYVGCPKWKTGCYSCPQKKAYPKSILLDNSKSNYKRKERAFTSLKNLTLITPSKWLAGLVSQSYLGGYEVKVIPNGIDLNIFKPTESDIRAKYKLKNKFVVLGVASVWDERKGLKDFVKLSTLLEDDYKIVLVGLTEQQIKEMPPSIIALERTNSAKELAQLYSAADVFVNPTYEDNFPTTNLEALACGTPVITYKTGGSPESIDNTCGAVVKKGDINALVHALAAFKAYKPSQELCVARAANYDKNICFMQYIALMDRLVNKD